MHCLYSTTTALFQAYSLDVSKHKAKKDARRENVCVCVCVFAFTYISIPLLSIFPALVVTLFHSSIKRVDKMCKSRVTQQDFRDGTVDESLPASVRDMGSIPDLGGSHVPRSSWARALKLLNQHAATTAARKPRPVLHSKRSHRGEKPTHSN